MILAIQALDCSFGLDVVQHFDEAEPTASTCLSIAQDLSRAHGPELFEHFLKMRRRDCVLEVANVKPLRHRTRPVKALHRPRSEE
jgi:hypothetical protein